LCNSECDDPTKYVGYGRAAWQGVEHPCQARQHPL
jgi:hypothetical protein